VYQKFLLENIEVNIGGFDLETGGRGVANTMTGYYLPYVTADIREEAYRDLDRPLAGTSLGLELMASNLS
jgi:hypothetical protein